jgi:hypothetical protein
LCVSCACVCVRARVCGSGAARRARLVAERVERGVLGLARLAVQPASARRRGARGGRVHGGGGVKGRLHVKLLGGGVKGRLHVKLLGGGVKGRLHVKLLGRLHVKLLAWRAAASCDARRTRFSSVRPRRPRSASSSARAHESSLPRAASSPSSCAAKGQGDEGLLHLAGGSRISQEIRHSLMSDPTLSYERSDTLL